MPIAVNRIMLKSYVRIEDNLLECSIRNIEVTDKKIVDLWEDGSVFRVHNEVEFNNEEKTNQDVEKISPAMYTSCFYVRDRVAILLAMKAILTSILVTCASIGITKLCHGCYQCSHTVPPVTRLQ